MKTFNLSQLKKMNFNCLKEVKILTSLSDFLPSSFLMYFVYEMEKYNFSEEEIEKIKEERNIRKLERLIDKLSSKENLFFSTREDDIIIKIRITKENFINIYKAINKYKENFKLSQDGIKKLIDSIETGQEFDHIRIIIPDIGNIYLINYENGWLLLFYLSINQKRKNKNVKKYLETYIINIPFLKNNLIQLKKREISILRKKEIILFEGNVNCLRNYALRLTKIENIDIDDFYKIYDTEKIILDTLDFTIANINILYCYHIVNTFLDYFKIENFHIEIHSF